MQTSVKSNPLVGAAQLEESIVQGSQGPHWRVTSSLGICVALRAASCLIEPEIGDKVLLSVSAQSVYIVAVLDKAGAATRLEFAGDLEISARGSLNVVAHQDMQLSAANRLDQQAGELTQVSARHKVVTGELRGLITRLDLHSKQIVAKAEQIESSIERCFHKAKQVMRWVDTVETLNVGNLIQQVRNTLSSRAKQNMISASEDVRVDAKRIHMG